MIQSDGIMSEENLNRANRHVSRLIDIQADQHGTPELWALAAQAAILNELERIDS